MSFHYVHLRTFAHATESEDRVKAALKFAAGDVDISTTETKGHFGNPLIVFETKITKKRDVKSFFTRLGDVGIIGTLASELDERVDDECNLHFRLSKQMAFDGELALASDGDVIACTAKIATYPASRDKALIVARLFIEEIIAYR